MKKNILKNKILVILGSTASGKTGLAVKLAREFNGEIISADSRQVYKGMDIGTGKDLCEYGDVPYHLIDVIKPNTKFNLAKYQKLANIAIEDILSRGKLPIIVGGTGLYLQAIVDNFNLSSVKPDKKLREKLEKLDAEKVFKKLEKINSKFANKLNESDKKNKRRLIRYMEIASQRECNLESTRIKNYEFLLIGLTWPRKVLLDRIYKRLIDRLEKEGMVDEVKNLHKHGVSWKRLESFGLEYRYVSLYLRKKLTYDEMVEKLNIAIRQFAKKQMSWYKRWEKQGAKIYWVKNNNESKKIVNKFLKK
ncbi:MAG: tRNA (adenosine(37)-N6)-dimethylallyltransferase MiaA [Candidatus Falkowbacteria bacterium]